MNYWILVETARPSLLAQPRSQKNNPALAHGEFETFCNPFAIWHLLTFIQVRQEDHLQVFFYGTRDVTG